MGAREVFQEVKTKLLRVTTLYLNGTALTATAAEINRIAGLTAGVAAASKNLVLGATKNVDTLLFNVASVGALGNSQGTAAAMTADTNFVADSDGTKGVKLPVAVAGRRIWVKNTFDATPNLTLKVYPATGAAINGLGANAAITIPAGGVAMFLALSATQWYASAIPDGITADSSEINVLDGATAGLVVASKAAVLGANKELDEVHATALYLGAAGGTLLTPTAAEINKVSAAGYLTDGLNQRRTARFTFDASIAGNQTIAPHGTGVTLPQHAIVVGGFFDVNTVFHSAGADAGTIAISVESANDIQTAAACSGAPYSTIGRKAIVPKNNTPETTSVKTTVAREITVTVAGQVLSAGKLTGFLEYVVSVASA